MLYSIPWVTRRRLESSNSTLYLVGQSSALTIAGCSGISGSNSTMSHTPYSVKLDNQLNLYVTDTVNNRV